MTTPKRPRLTKKKVAPRHPREAKQSSHVALQDLAQALQGLPKSYARTIGELLLQVLARAESLPEDFFERLEAISVYGADPDWQNAELAKLVAELKIRH